MIEKGIESGTVLLAEPFMLDPNFRRSAVLLCEHNEEGSFGLIMNKPLRMRVDEWIEDFPEFEGEVFFGGPVQPNVLSYVHNVGDLLEDSRYIVEGVYWGGDFNKLKFLISSKLIMPENIRFFVGYSGWSEGQLADEMNLGSWVSANMDANYLFKSPPSRLWEQVMYNKGNVYTVISKVPDDFSWN